MDIYLTITLAIQDGFVQVASMIPYDSFEDCWADAEMFKSVLSQMVEQNGITKYELKVDCTEK